MGEQVKCIIGHWIFFVGRASVAHVYFLLRWLSSLDWDYFTRYFMR